MKNTYLFQKTIFSFAFLYHMLKYGDIQKEAKILFILFKLLNFTVLNIYIGNLFNLRSKMGKDFSSL